MQCPDIVCDMATSLIQGYRKSTLLVTCSIHPHIRWRHCTTLFEMEIFCFKSNSNPCWLEINVCRSVYWEKMLICCDTIFVLLKTRLTLCKIDISGYCVRLSPDVVVYGPSNCTILERTPGENISVPLKVYSLQAKKRSEISHDSHMVVLCCRWSRMSVKQHALKLPVTF